VKSLSLKRKATRSVAIAIIGVSLLAATIYYSIPDRFHVRSIAFALGPIPPDSSNSSTVGSLGAYVRVRFLNGTSVLVQRGTSFEVGRFGTTPIVIVTPNWLNSTDIEDIEVDFGMCPGYVTLPKNWSSAIVTYTMGWKISSALTDDRIVDLGSYEVTNWTLSEQGVPQQEPAPIFPHITENNASQFWAWHINREQIQNILPSTTGSANVSFSLDLSANVHYQVTTDVGTQNGAATEHWSGNWGTLELLLDSGKLLGFRFDFPYMGICGIPIY
jgi:hypothetical protein